VGAFTELLAKRDREAQDELYRQTEPELRKLAQHWIHRYKAKNLVRTTEVMDAGFVRLFQDLVPDVRHRGAYFLFASRNLFRALIDLLRVYFKQHRFEHERDGLDDDMPAPAEPLTIRTVLTLQGALEDLGSVLSETHRQVVELLILAECTMDEVAKLLSINRYKVRSMRNVALAYLHEKLGPSFPDLDHSSKHANRG
jgi:RNA polymerase sigma factor (sigma-70 family)